MRSPHSSANASLIKPPSANIAPILEDYSDIGDDEELEEKVADFKGCSYLLTATLVILLSF